MRKFRFKLETVAHHRTVLEQQAMQLFATIHGELAVSIQRIELLEAQFREVLEGRAVFGIEPSDRGIAVEELLLRERELDGLRLKIEEEGRVREGLEARLEDARKALVHSRQDRETIERLREIDREAHRFAIEKYGQDLIDELATMRHGRAGRL